MTAQLILRVLGFVLPIVLVPVVYASFRFVSNHVGALDALPPWAKKLSVTLLGVALTGLLDLLGVGLPIACGELVANGELTAACLDALQQGDWQKNVATTLAGAFVGLGAIGLHWLKKQPPNDLPMPRRR